MHYLQEELYEKVKADSEIFEFLQNGSLDGIWYWDIEKPENEWMSTRFKELFGYEDFEISNTSEWWQENIDPEDLKVAISNFEKHCADSSHAYDQIVRYNHKNGSSVWVRCRGLAIRDQKGKPIRMLGAHSDVTELIETQKKLEKSKAKAEESEQLKLAFLANMSHEIRTPLNGILGMIELLKSDVVSAEGLEKISIIEECGEVLLNVIGDILEISRIESGEMKLNNRPTDIISMLASLEYVFKKRFSNNTVDLKFKLDKSSSQSNYLIDDLRLKQILNNFLSNSFKFTSSGKITLSLSITNNPNGNSTLYFSVEDTGIGIEKSKLDSIFEPFVQENSSITRQFGGTGLGLSISRALAHLMKGEVRVESEKNKGSKFILELPAMAIDPSDEKLKEAIIDIGSKKLNQLNVLIVEDNIYNFQVLKGLLLKFNLKNITRALSGSEAISLATENNYDLILMDCHLPDISGQEITKQIRKNSSSGATAIIGVSADVMEENRELALRSGMNHFLEKPVNPDSLREAISSCLK